MRNYVIHALGTFFCGCLVAGCSSPDDTASPPTADVTNAPVKSGAALQALLDADALFLEASQTVGIAEAYRQFLAPEAIQMLNGYPPIEGRSNIYANFAGLADAATSVSLSWELEGADVAASGDLGYTWGTYYYVGPDEQGDEGLLEGSYVNIWRKSLAGKWEVVVDIENRQMLAEEEWSEESAAPLSADEWPIEDAATDPATIENSVD